MSRTKADRERDEQRLAELVNASRHFVRHQRKLDYESCAEIAERCETGAQAAEAIRATLARSGP